MSVDVERLADELADRLQERLADRLAPSEPLLSPAQVAERLGVSQRFVRDLLARKVIPSVKIEGARRVERAAVEEYIAARRDA